MTDLNIIPKLVSEISNSISKQIDEHIKLALAKSGYTFETKEDLVYFIKNNCECHVIGNEHIYKANGIIFCIFTKDNTPQLNPEGDFVVNYGTFTY